MKCVELQEDKNGMEEYGIDECMEEWHGGIWHGGMAWTNGLDVGRMAWSMCVCIGM